MNITFLIGNGFDLNIGLKTKYSDFIKQYVNVINGNQIIKDFKSHIANENLLWSDAEIAFGKYTSNYSDKQGLENFLICHQDFCEELGKYLQKEEDRVPFNEVSEKIARAFLLNFKDITLGFREIQRNKIMSTMNSFGEGLKFNFINFNYTKVLDKCITFAKKIDNPLGNRIYNHVSYRNSFGDVLHVHGYTDRDMALGLNDETQIANKLLFENAEIEDKYQIIKRMTNQMNEQNIDEKTYQLLKNSDLIYIYGMSIGETDAIWWKRICELMQKKTNLRVIIQKYDMPKEGTIRRAYIKNEREQRERFIKYLNKDNSNNESILDRIHITNSNIFSGLTSLVRDDIEDLALIEEELSKI